MNKADQSVCNIFTRTSHHRNVSVVFNTQHLFHRNCFVRTMNLNTPYIGYVHKSARCRAGTYFITTDVSREASSLWKHRETPPKTIWVSVNWPQDKNYNNRIRTKTFQMIKHNTRLINKGIKADVSSVCKYFRMSGMDLIVITGQIVVFKLYY